MCDTATLHRYICRRRTPAPLVQCGCLLLHAYAAASGNVGPVMHQPSSAGATRAPGLLCLRGCKRRLQRFIAPTRASCTAWRVSPGLALEHTRKPCLCCLAACGAGCTQTCSRDVGFTNTCCDKHGAIPSLLRARPAAPVLYSLT